MAGTPPEAMADAAAEFQRREREAEETRRRHEQEVSSQRLTAATWVLPRYYLGHGDCSCKP